MTLTESTVEEAALEWFGEQSRVALTLIPAFSHREKEREREAIRPLNRAIPDEARAAIKRYLIARFKERLNS